jgi:hypothetical protein
MVESLPEEPHDLGVERNMKRRAVEAWWISADVGHSSKEPRTAGRQEVVMTGAPERPLSLSLGRR